MQVIKTEKERKTFFKVAIIYKDAFFKPNLRKKIGRCLSVKKPLTFFTAFI
jgi:hypothetical protein